MYALNNIAPNTPEEWMESLYSIIQYRRLNEIIIPGTHDSGCYGFDSVSIKTQDKTIEEQLRVGVRYFDLRFLCTPTGFHIHHGLAKSLSITLTDIVEPIKRFMEDFSKEIVILHITHFQNFNKGDYERFISEIMTYLSPFMAERPSSKVLPTIKEMVDKNQRVVISSDFGYEDASSPLSQFIKGFIWNNIDSPYDEGIYQSGRPDRIIEYLTKEVSNRGNRNLWVLQGVMTLDTAQTIAGGLPVVGDLINLLPPDVSIETYAEKINPVLRDNLYSHDWRGNCNIFICDFVSHDLIEAVIQINFDFRDRISSGTFLEPGQQLRSRNGYYRLVYQEDGNLVLYRQVLGKQDTSLFDSKTYGKTPWRTYYEGGTLAVYTSEEDYNQGRAAWKCAPRNSLQKPEACALIVQNDGNVVSYGGDKSPLWEKQDLGYQEASLVNPSEVGPPPPLY